MYFSRQYFLFVKEDQEGFKQLQLNLICMIKGSPNEYKTMKATGVVQNNHLFALLLHFLCITCAVQLTSVVQDNQLFALQTEFCAGISYPLYQGGAHVLEDVFVLNH